MGHHKKEKAHAWGLKGRLEGSMTEMEVMKQEQTPPQTPPQNDQKRMLDDSVASKKNSKKKHYTPVSDETVEEEG